MKKLCLITILLASAFLFTLEASATKYYVNDISLTNDIYTTAIGNNSNSGTSPNAPKLTLGAAITAASADDTIYVDAGTYTGTGNISLNITKTLTIIGAGTGNTIFTSHTNNRFVRIQALNVTISNMQIYDFFLEGHGQAIMVDANKTGFTLTNIVMKRNLGAGNAGGSSIYLSSGSSTTINSILFSCSGFNGSYGGAIKVDNATLVMNKSVFFQARDNDGLGGAIGISGASSNIKIYNSVFKQCNSRAGGAISQTGGTLLVSGSCFMDNFIQGDASSNTNGGGHYYSTGTIVSAKFSNCSFTGAFFCSSTNPPSGSICEFSSNTSNDGKAISLRTVSGNFTFDTCYFDNSNISTSFDLGLDLYLKGGASCFVNINSCKFGNDQMPSNANKSNIYNADLPSANLIVTASGAAQTTQNQDGTDGNNFSYKGNAPGGTSNNNLPTTDPITSCTNVTIAGCDNISINCATENNPPVIISCATDKTITDCSALGDYRSEVAAFDDCSLTVSQNPPPGTQLNDGAHTVTLTVTDEAGNSTACNITVTVSGCGCTPPAPPTGTSTQNFCAIDSATVGDLQANGSNIQWYNAPTGGTLYLSTDALVNNSTYYATQTVSGCESTTRLAVVVTISNPSAPTGTSAQNFCAIDSGTVADLFAIGSNLQWYAAPTGGTPYLNTTPLVNGLTYYATQTVGSCESETRMPVSVLISNPAAPTGTSAQNFCALDSATVADLVANGNNVQWYAAPTGGTPYLNTTALVNGLTYYATQTVGSCKSVNRLSVSVTIIQNPILNLTAPSVCSGTNALITASAAPPDVYTYLWNVPTDMGNPGNISSFTTSVAGNYSVTVTDTHGCSSSETDTLVFYSNPVINNVIQDATCPGSNDGMITLAVSGGTEPYDYTWSNGTSNAQLIGISGGTYTISVSDYNNCSVSDTLTVNITSEDCLNIPTAFSPNGDGINDTWEIEHIDLYDEIVIEIYNRWGQLIFSYSGPGKGYADLSNRWDGTFKGKVLPVSSFIFTLDLKDGNKPTQGIVSIIK